MINNNTHNPIPMHSSTDRWYNKYPTYKGACNCVVAPNGYLLPMMLTCGETDLPELSVRFAVGSSGYGQPLKASMIPTNGIYEFRTDDEVHKMKLTYADGTYTMIIDGYECAKVSSSPVRSDFLFTKEELMDTDNRTVYSYNGDTLVQTYILFNTIISGRENVTAKVVSCESGTETNVSLTLYYDLVPDTYRTTQRCATIYLGGNVILGGQSEGAYYLQFDVGGETYYSEPFMWINDLTNFVHITYRRSQPIVMTKNYIPFTQTGESRFMEMWVKGICAKPPFHFEEEIETIDGSKFVEKQVSYRDDKFKFLCSAYFADAVRMLWHCDDRQYDQFNNIRDVDYMEPPEPNWDVDAHLCEITIEFQSDTIVQTNGEPKMNTNGNYGSFSSDYNGDYQDNA